MAVPDAIQFPKSKIKDVTPSVLQIFTGPAYPHGKSNPPQAEKTRIEPNEPNGLWVDRMILVSVVGD